MQIARLFDRTPRLHCGLFQWFSVPLIAGAMAACTSTPQRAPDSGAVPTTPRSYATDGPLPDAPKDLERTPDAEPRIEPVRASGPNKPYQVAGEVYVPFTDDRALVESGLASWYGRKFHGRPTASGELYNMFAMTAAHPTLPIPSYARVRNPANGREVIVRVNDRGPFVRGRIVDLSYTAALKLGILRGVQPVELERITHEDIRNGRWQATAASVPAPVSAPAPDPAPGTPVRAPRELAGQDLTRNGQISSTGPASEPPPGTPTSASLVAVAPMALPVSAALPLPAAAMKNTAPKSSPSEATNEPPVQRHPVRTNAGRGWWVQIGAFRERTGALNFQGEMARTAPWLAPLLGLFDERGLHKLQAGPFTAKGEALSMMERLRDSLRLAPVLVERR